MFQPPTAMILPRDFSELRMLVWNRDVARPIAPAEALALCERNWRFVDAEHMTERETKLVENLVEQLGTGYVIV